MTASILIVEDEAAIHQLLSYNLAAEGFRTRVVETGEEVHAAINEEMPDLVLLDLGLPDGNGIAVIDTLRKSVPKCKVLALTVFEDRASVLATLRAGADGYILKDTPPAATVEAVRATLAGETPISARAAGHLLSLVRDDAPPKEADANRPTLSGRERELLEHLARGLSRKEAARRMDLSPFTVGEYVQNIYRKLSVRSRGEAVYEAIQARLIKIDQV